MSNRSDLKKSIGAAKVAAPMFAVFLGFAIWFPSFGSILMATASAFFLYQEIAVISSIKRKAAADPTYLDQGKRKRRAKRLQGPPKAN